MAYMSRMSVRFGRTIRHAPYNISKVEVELEMMLDQQGNPEEVMNELREDVQYVVQSITEEQKRRVDHA